MGKSAILSGGQSFMNTLTTVYCGVGSCDVENNITTEAQRQTPFRTAGVLSNLYFRLPAVSASGSFVITLRKNGADTAVTLTTPAGTSGHFLDSTNTVSVAVDDLIDYKMTLSAGDGWPIQLGCVFDAAGGTVSRFSISTGGSTTKSSVSTEYAAMSAYSGLTATEANVRTRIRIAGTWKGMFVYVTANTRTAATIFKSRKNGADGNQSVSVGSSATGRFQDTSNTDTVASGDEINNAITISTGSGTITFTHWGSEIVTTDGSYQLISSEYDGNTIDFNKTEYGKLSGAENYFSTWHWHYPLLQGICRGFSVNVRANTINAGVSTFEILNTSTNKYICVQIPAGVTGIFENVGEALLNEQANASALLVMRMRTSTSAASGNINYYGISTTHFPFETHDGGDQVQRQRSIPLDSYYYTVASMAISMATLTGAATSLTLGDDELSGWITLPFTFTFFGNPKYQLKVCSNGYIHFSGTSTSASPALNSNNMLDSILPFASDLDPSSGGTIKYETFGSNPNRIFVIEWNAVPYFDAGGETVTFQMKLFEADNHIELHVSDGSNTIDYLNCQGIMSAAGLAYFYPRNFTLSGQRFEEALTNDAVTFVPVNNT